MTPLTRIIMTLRLFILHWWQNSMESYSIVKRLTPIIAAVVAHRIWLDQRVWHSLWWAFCVVRTVVDILCAKVRRIAIYTHCVLRIINAPKSTRPSEPQSVAQVMDLRETRSETIWPRPDVRVSFAWTQIFDCSWQPVFVATQTPDRTNVLQMDRRQTQ